LFVGFTFSGADGAELGCIFAFFEATLEMAIGAWPDAGEDNLTASIHGDVAQARANALALFGHAAADVVGIACVVFGMFVRRREVNEVDTAFLLHGG